MCVLNDCSVFAMHLAWSVCTSVNADVNVLVEIYGTKAEAMVVGNSSIDKTGLAVRRCLEWFEFGRLEIGKGTEVLISNDRRN